MHEPRTDAPVVTRRPITRDDASFLLRVYASSREREMAAAPWDEAHKTAFLQQQLAARTRHYREHFPDAEHSVLERDARTRCSNAMASRLAGCN